MPIWLSEFLIFGILHIDLFHFLTWINRAFAERHGQLTSLSWSRTSSTLSLHFSTINYIVCSENSPFW